MRRHSLTNKVWAQLSSGFKNVRFPISDFRVRSFSGFSCQGSPLSVVRFSAFLISAVCFLLSAFSQTQPLLITQVAPSSSISANGSTVVISWRGGAGPFQVQCTPTLNGVWQDVAGVTSAYTQTNIPQGPTAFYRVQSMANVLSATTDKTAPSVPSGLSAAAASSSRINLSWNASTDTGNHATGIKGYNIYRGGVFLKQVLASTTSASDTGLAPANSYSYTVAAVDNAFNQSAQSSAVTATTLGNATCGYVLSPTSASFPNGGGSGSFSTIANGGCPWTASASAPWISITSGQSGTGNGAVGYSIASNTGNNQTGTITVAGQVFTVNQSGLVCVSSISPSSASYSYKGGTGSITVSDTANCVWLASSTSPWITITSASSGTGNGSVSYSVATNTGTSSLTGTLTIAGQTFTVTEGGNTNGQSVASGTLQWVQTNLPPYTARVNAVATDRAGNTIAVGYFYTEVDFGSGLIMATGYYDAFVAKYTPQGALSWVKKLGGTGYDNAYGVAIDSQTNIIVVGTFQGSADFGGGTTNATGGATDQDIFVAKYSPSGAYIWSKGYGSYANDFPTSVAVDGSDNVLVASQSGGTVYFGNGLTKTGAGGYDVTLGKFSGATGAALWGQMYGGTANDIANSVAVDHNGDVLVTGMFAGGGNLGGTAFSGSTASGTFVAKYSGADGSYSWSWVFAGSGGNGIAADPTTGNVFATGKGSSGFFINAYNGSGTALWTKNYGSSGDAGCAIAADGSGNIALTGNCGSVDWLGNFIYSSGSGFFVASFTTSGTYRWAAQASPSQSYGYGVAFDLSGHVVAGGAFYSGTIVDFGGVSVAAAGGAYNGFVARYTK
jgi:hypothetical protein